MSLYIFQSEAKATCCPFEWNEELHEEHSWNMTSCVLACAKYSQSPRGLLLAFEKDPNQIKLVCAASSLYCGKLLTYLEGNLCHIYNVRSVSC